MAEDILVHVPVYQSALSRTRASQALNAQLELLLGNHIGALAVLQQALSAACAGAPQASAGAASFYPVEKK